MLILGRADLEALLEPRALIEALAAAFAAHAAGRTRVPARTVMPVTDDGTLLVMPAAAATAEGPALGTKLVSVYTGNGGRGLPTIHATYILLDGETGAPLALLEGESLTGLRTGATSALAARHLARPDSRRLVCIGAGWQAGFQLLCLAALLPIAEVAVIGRDPARAEAFATTWTTRLGLPVRVAADRVAAIAAADVITCATTSPTPVLDGRRLAPGAHVDLVGAFQPTAREADDETIRRTRVFVDQPGAIETAGDLAIPIERGVVGRSHVVGDLAQLVTGAVAGRTRPQEITLFKSVGFALEDLVAARLAYTRAKAQGRGREVTV
ncbi:MAG: ornithine cyclodeaminase family protein [Candidatus Rokubacteria bacterium]|nr:ornithine cyclodeaminase family protein [Candidatus Rokubacteria bacterium]